MSNGKHTDILLAHMQGKQAMFNAKRADILLAHNQGKQIQMFLTGETNAEDPEFHTWVDVAPENVKHNLAWCSDCVEFRVKPETIEQTVILTGETKMKHKHAETLKAILNGEQLQVKQGGENICSHGAHNAWVDISSNRALTLIGLGYTDTEFRIEPKTLCINGMEFPKPLNNLNQGDIYWVATDLMRACCVEHLGFTGYLEAGLAFASKADCEAFLAALKSVLNP